MVWLLEHLLVHLTRQGWGTREHCCFFHMLYLEIRCRSRVRSLWRRAGTSLAGKYAASVATGVLVGIQLGPLGGRKLQTWRVAPSFASRARFCAGFSLHKVSQWSGISLRKVLTWYKLGLLCLVIRDRCQCLSLLLRLLFSYLSRLCDLTWRLLFAGVRSWETGWHGALIGAFGTWSFWPDQLSQGLRSCARMHVRLTEVCSLCVLFARLVHRIAWSTEQWLSLGHCWLSSRLDRDLRFLLPWDMPCARSLCLTRLAVQNPRSSHGTRRHRWLGLLALAAATLSHYWLGLPQIYNSNIINLN